MKSRFGPVLPKGSGLRARSLRTLLGAVVLAVLFTAAEAQPERQGLSTGATVERLLAGGETHSYSVEAISEKPLLVTVDQHGIDVAVEARRPDGSVLIAVDGPTDRDGPESLLLPPDTSGLIEIRVRSANLGVAPGTYTVRLETVDESHVEAERRMTEAGARNLEGTAESLRLAATRYQEARDLWRSLGDRQQEARCARSAAEVLASLGDPKTALNFFQQALALSNGLADEAGQAVAWSGIGLAQTALGDSAAALTSLRRSLEIENRLGRAHQKARTLNNLGLALHARGDLREALDFYQQALEIFRAAGEKGAWEAAVLQNVALANVGLGKPEAALRSHQQVLALQRALGDRKGEAQTLNNLGTLYINLGEPGQALESYAPALAIFRQSGDRLWEAALLHNLGVTYYGLGDYDRARVNLEPALAIRREAGDRRGEARTEVSLGHVLFQLGELPAALDAARQAAKVAEAASDRGGEMLARLLLGEVSAKAGKPAEALPELARARDLARSLENRLTESLILQVLGQAHLALSQPETAAEVLARAVELARFVKSPASAVGALTGLARAKRKLGRPVEARARLAEALREIETFRATETDPDLRASFLASRHAAFELEILLLMESNQPRAALEVSERARARSLLDLLQESEIRRQSPRYAALTQPSLATSAEIQGLLDGETTLLEYSLGEEKSFLWAVDRESVTAFELPAQARIEAAAREVYSRLSVLSPGEKGLEKAAADLGRMILGPVASRLGQRRLIVIADGELQYIPFGTLTVANEDEPLLVRHEIVNAPSASTLVLQRRLARRQPAPGTLAVLADPVFDPNDPRVLPRVVPQASVAPSATVLSTASSPLLRLPWTRREAQAITAAVPAGQSLLALDFQASRETALSPELARYRIVHFATHGLIDSRTPALSGLMLSSVGKTGAPQEGFLGLRDIYNLRLGADLVVLSGCETALGKEVRGEGLVGLTQGFLYAGARQVLASLWRVEDRATAELMSRFYRALLVEGRSPAAALRFAQLAIRRDKRWRSPFYWSGFVLQGDSSPEMKDGPVALGKKKADDGPDS